MDKRAIDKLRQRGLTTSTSAGLEAVVVTAQFRDSLTNLSRQQRKDVLEEWQVNLGKQLEKHGAEIVPDSLSVLGQTIEALVPTENFKSTEEDLVSQDLRVDLVVPRNVTG